jgi:hypothetical protein
LGVARHDHGQRDCQDSVRHLKDPRSFKRFALAGSG